MAIESGTRFGSYEIGETIGAGGMGEVYRATDAKLGRDVAIKLLPAEGAGKAERLARVEREAKRRQREREREPGEHEPDGGAAAGAQEHARAARRRNGERRI